MVSAYGGLRLAAGASLASWDLLPSEGWRPGKLARLELAAERTAGDVISGVCGDQQGARRAIRSLVDLSRGHADEDRWSW